MGKCRTSAVKGHAPGAGKVVLLETAAVNGLLGEGVTGGEEDLRLRLAKE